MTIAPSTAFTDLHHFFAQLDLPYSVFPDTLYNKDTLFGGFDRHYPDSYESTLDRRVYNRYKAAGTESSDVVEMTSRSLHDCSIRLALSRFLKGYDERRIIAIMGGHNMSRLDPMYAQVARLARTLAEQGYLMMSGGGPGAMEATHLGAWFVGRTDDELAEAIDALGSAPLYNDRQWLPTAFEVIDRYPDAGARSLSIPTWFYGHEPPTPFATDIAKLFENSLREEGLLAIAKGGIVYSPGSAGTLQEVFQDLAQNHYESYGYASPMLFLDRKFWTETCPVYPFIRAQIDAGRLNRRIELGLYDTPAEIVAAFTRTR